MFLVNLKTLVSYTLYPVNSVVWGGSEGWLVHPDTRAFSIFQSAEKDCTIIEQGSRALNCQEVMWVVVVATAVVGGGRQEAVELTDGHPRRIH